MKLLIPRDELVALIGKIQSVISAKPALPILANVLLEAVNDQLIVSATDLTVSMRAFCEARVQEEGAIALPARRLFQLIRELTSPQVEITATTESALIQSGSSHFKIQGMHKTEFPKFPDLADFAHLEIPTSIFKELLVRTAFAAAKDDSRQVLNGILMQREHEQIILIGTDGKRLAKIEANFHSPSSNKESYVIPLKAVEEIVKILDSKENAAKLTFMPDKMAVEVGNVVLITKLLSGQYPDISRVIPQKNNEPISLHREELMTLLKQVALFTSETNHSVRFSFTSGNLHLSALSGEIGEGKVNMPVNYNGPKLDIAFNPYFFLDILRHSKDETVHFVATDSYNPGLITDSTTAQFVIMPMRLETL